jgi:hypothetical protein
MYRCIYRCIDAQQVDVRVTVQTSSHFGWPNAFVPLGKDDPSLLPCHLKCGTDV